MTHSNSDELKPCPFCGGEAKFTKDGDEYVERYIVCQVICKKCHSAGQMHQCHQDDIYGGKKLTIAAWNTRASRPDPAPVCDGKVGEAIEWIDAAYKSGDADETMRQMACQFYWDKVKTAAKETEALRERVKELEDDEIERDRVRTSQIERQCFEIAALQEEIKAEKGHSAVTMAVLDSYREENTRLRAELAKQPERVTVEQLKKDNCLMNYFELGTILRTKYPNGLIIVSNERGE